MWSLVLGLSVASVLFCAGVAASQLTTAEQVHRLGLKESEGEVPVKISGVVTYVRGTGREVVVQDETGGVMVDWPEKTVGVVAVGMRVEVEGHTAIHPPTPRVMATAARILGSGEMPDALRMTVGNLPEADLEGSLVECEDVIRVVRIEEVDVTPARLVLEVGPADRRLFIWISRWDEASRKTFVPGMTVRVRGVLMRWKTVQWMPVSTFVVVHEPSWVTVTASPPSAEEVELSEIGDVPGAAGEMNPTKHFRVRGVVGFSDGNVTVLTKDEESLWVRVRDGVRLVPGDRVEAVGFPGIHGPRSELEDAAVRKLGSDRVPAAARLVPESFVNQGPMWFDGRRVRLRGVVAGGAGVAEDAPLYLDFGGRLLPVNFAERTGGGGLPVVGSVVDATGVLEAGLNLQIRRIGRGIGDYRLHVQRAGDLDVIREGPWWTPGRVTMAFLSIVAIAGVAAVWALMLNRRVEEKSRALVQEIAAKREREILSAERQRLAGDLHDTIEQTLTGAALQLDALESGGSARPLILARRLLDRSRDELRRAVWDLTPGVLEEKGLEGALEAIGRNQGECGSVRVATDFKGRGTAVPDRVASHLCRVVQEAMANAVRHGKASVIRLSTAVEAGWVSVSVEDDGGGFSPGDAPGISSGHFGINGMKERLRRLGGEFEIDSRPGGPTVVRVRCPFEEIPSHVRGDV